MFETLSRLLGSKDRLLGAIDARDSWALLDLIKRRDFTVLGYPESEGLDPATATEEEFDEHLQWEADQLADDMAGDEELEAMTVECDGRTALLAFTKEKYVDHHIEKITMELNRLVGVPAFDVSGETLLEMVPEDCDILLNAGSEEERLIDHSLLSGRG